MAVRGGLGRIGSMQELIAELNAPEGKPLMVGKLYAHDETGQLLRVTRGGWMGEEGISNHFHWDVLDELHRPTGETGHGYGWYAEPIPELGPDSVNGRRKIWAEIADRIGVLDEHSEAKELGALSGELELWADKWLQGSL